MINTLFLYYLAAFVVAFIVGVDVIVGAREIVRVRPIVYLFRKMNKLYFATEHHSTQPRYTVTSSNMVLSNRRERESKNVSI